MKKIFTIVVLLATSLKVYGDVMAVSGYFFDDNCPREKPFSYGTVERGYKFEIEKG